MVEDGEIVEAGISDDSPISDIADIADTCYMLLPCRSRKVKLHRRRAGCQLCNCPLDCAVPGASGLHLGQEARNGEAK